MMLVPIDEQIGRRLRRRRHLTALTQVQLGRFVGIRFQQVHKYETGANAMTASRVWEFAQALGVDVEYFFDGLSKDTDYRPPAILARSPDRYRPSRADTREFSIAIEALKPAQRASLIELADSLSKDGVEGAAA